MKNAKLGTNFAAEDLGKEDLTKALAILLDMVGFEGQLMKLSLPALRKMFNGISHNAIQTAQIRRETVEARKELKISQDRLSSFERESRKVK